MQLMSWLLARLGSRFSLLFEPHRRRVMHSALGRFLDTPLDLMVGLVEPDGTQRALPFSVKGEPFHNPEQFERLNSITFRGYCPTYRLRYEFNVHSVFYPQDERLCLMPAFYLEMRVSPTGTVRWMNARAATPERVKLFLRLDRPGAQISGSLGPQGAGRLDLNYKVVMQPRQEGAPSEIAAGTGARTAEVRERIVSVSPEPCVIDADGKGMMIELPVTEPGSGIKWRLVWGAYCGEQLLEVGRGPAEAVTESSTLKVRPARLRYVNYWKSIDEVMAEATSTRDDRLAHSRRLEKLADQAPIRNAERHLLNQSFQSFLSNSFWCDLSDGQEWFSVWEGSGLLHSTLDVAYTTTPFYLSLWPRLLRVQFGQWAGHSTRHEPSDGAFLHHDLGEGLRCHGKIFPFDMPVEENASFLLMMQAYAHFTGDTHPASDYRELIERLARYLLWTDRDRSGFASEGMPNSMTDGGPALHLARKQTYLAVKRLAALSAAADLLRHAGASGGGTSGGEEFIRKLERAAEQSATKVNAAAWLGDHFAVCVDESTDGLVNPVTNEPLSFEQMPGHDAYSIHTGNGLLLPMMCGREPALDAQRLTSDLVNALRETLGPYGCSHTSSDPDQIHLSQNLWRDMLARYLGIYSLSWTPNYWDLQVMSNTHQQSLGCCDSYIFNNLSFYPRPIVSIGLLLAYPRLTVDRLAPGGAKISVDPDRHYPQRWPLFPLADWKAGKVPVCVVGAKGRVTIEGESDPVTLRGDAEKK